MQQAPARGTGQEEFLDSASLRPVNTVGELRPILGDEGERIAAEMLRAERLQTVVGHWCPDLKGQRGKLYEVKLCAPSTSLCIHESQIAAFERDEPGYTLAVVFYPGALALPSTERAQRDHLRDSVSGLMLVQCATVRRYLSTIEATARADDGRSFKHIRWSQLMRWWRSRTCSRTREEVDTRFVERRAYSSFKPGVRNWWPYWCANVAEIMIDDLAHHRDEIILLEAPRPQYPGHMVRIKIDSNPSWYSEILDSRTLPSRADRKVHATSIKRSEVVTMLRRIVAGKPLHQNSEDLLWPHMLAIHKEINS